MDKYKNIELQVKHLVRKRTDYTNMLIALGIGTFGLWLLELPSVKFWFLFILGITVIFTLLIDITFLNEEIQKKIGGP